MRGVEGLGHLQARIIDALRQALSALWQAHGGETFYAYALYTDSSAMTVGLSANSHQGLARAIAGQDDHSPATLAYYRWATAEWAYEGWGAAAFQTICTDLRTAPERQNFPAFKAQVIATMTAALKALIDEGFFGDQTARERLTFFVSISDDDQAEAVEAQSAAILNAPPVYQAFLGR